MNNMIGINIGRMRNVHVVPFYGGVKMIRPKPEEVTAYALTIGFKLVGEWFCDYYESKGWLVGKTPMKDWRAAVRTWKHKASPSALMDVPRYDPEKIERRKRELEEIKEREWQRRMGEFQNEGIHKPLGHL
jgi:hypothetical protein